MLIRHYITCITVGVLTGCAVHESTRLDATNLLAVADLFGTTRGTFVVQDLGTGRTLRHDSHRAAERLSPFSTFKIANALTGLDCGVASDSSYSIAYDPQRDPEQDWWASLGVDWARNHDLHSAMQNSVVWYYQELARRIGPQRMAQGLARLDYGNRDISGGLDRFWLGSSLRISADEQVEFLRRLYSGELPVSNSAMATVIAMLELETGDGYVLRGKTGGGRRNGVATGWLVGYLECDDAVYAYALNIDGPDFRSIRDRRRVLARGCFEALGLMPNTGR